MELLCAARGRRVGDGGGQVIREPPVFGIGSREREKNWGFGVRETNGGIPALPIISRLTFLKLSFLIFKMEKQFIELLGE